MKKILITSGGTREYIDDVRVLTNISTGKLGAKIAERFLSENKFERHKEAIINYEVHYVAPETAAWPFFKSGIYHRDFTFHKITDVMSLYNTLAALVPQMDVVIHSMAVSDFSFNPIQAKLKSNDPMAFIESLKERIVMTPKIISRIKEWNPNCFLVGFKFEVGLQMKELINAALELMEKNKCNLVVANDKAEMIKLNAHIAYLIEGMSHHKIVSGKDKIADGIFDSVNSYLK